MNLVPRLIGAITLLLGATASEARQPNGTIVSETPYEFPSYQELVFAERRANSGFDEAAFRRRLPPERWEQMRAGQEASCFRLVYISDGLRIVGYLCRPVPGAGPYPAFIYSKAEDTISPLRLLALRRRASRGQLVLTTELRGNAGSEGRDEYGGADVRDFTALAGVAANLPDWDRRNLVAYGAGRGAMIILSAVRDGMPLTAAAVHSVPTDLAAWLAEQPSLRHAFVRTMPDYRANPERALRRRSAVAWPHRINVPIFLAAGSRRTPATDPSVPPHSRALPSAAGAIQLAQLLHRAGKRYELMVFDGDLATPAVDGRKDAAINDWFARLRR